MQRSGLWDFKRKRAKHASGHRRQVGPAGSLYGEIGSGHYEKPRHSLTSDVLIKAYNIL